LEDIAYSFCIAVYHRDIPALKSLGTDFFWLVGKAAALHLVAGVLVRVVSPFFIHIYPG
jgi:hypothetical protein